MADYRFSASIIGRSSGRSAIAAAAYRAAERIEDDRTGESHDYTRKQGILHKEILAPANAPEWMLDRHRLWNAVEAVERRVDAQLSREVQLSLPHELDAETNKQLVHDFVLEQFVSRGMIADVAIHAPSRHGDQRNFHAHVMLTTRVLTEDGFGKKAREWNAPAQLEEWREQWAHHQNRALSRAGESGRVDHRSYEDRGIDREPSLHMGPIAAEMDRFGLKTELGQMNADIQTRNDARAGQSGNVVDARERFERLKFDSWAERKRALLGQDKAQARGDLEDRAIRAAQRLESQFEEKFGPRKTQLEANEAKLDQRLEAKGFRKILRDMFGRTKRDRQELESVRGERGDIDKIEIHKRDTLKSAVASMRSKQDQAFEREQRALEAGIAKARKRRETADWQAKQAPFESRAPKASKEAVRSQVNRDPAALKQQKAASRASQRRRLREEELRDKLEASRGEHAPTPEDGLAREFAKSRQARDQDEPR